MANPLITIIIPAYNREDLISETLDSVLQQDYKNWECIIIDDGSTDNTTHVVNSYCEADYRFRLIQRPQNKPKGANSCRNIGIENSKGDYIQFLDSDDILGSKKIQLQLDALLKEDNRTIAICNWDRFYTNKNEAKFNKEYPYSKDFDSPKTFLNALGIKWIPPLCYLIPRKLIDLSGLWDENLVINQDAEFFSRVIIHASKVKYVHKAQVLYRYHTAGNVSGETQAKVQAKIDSLKLIASNVQSLYGTDKNPYIEGSKNQYYKRIKDRFPEVVKQNRQFFKNQIRDNFMIVKIMKKLKHIF